MKKNDVGDYKIDDKGKIKQVVDNFLLSIFYDYFIIYYVSDFEDYNL